MNFLQIFEKIIEMITPSFVRKKNLDRYERLKLFFNERDRIRKLNESPKVKQLLLNAATSALTGAKNAKIDEFEYFLEKFDTANVEDLYWAFVWNRASFRLSRNRNGKITYLHSVRKGRVQIRVLNSIMILFMVIIPGAFYADKDNFRNAFIEVTGLSSGTINLGYWIICLVCLTTIIKVLYDWYSWSDLNDLLKN